MALTSRVIPALYNGVSQQPPILRSLDQSEDELNSWASLADGVSKRPHTQHLGVLMASAPASVHIHHINRDTTERYVVFISSGSIRVFDLDGNEKTVNAPHGLSYLSAAGADYRTMTVADFTFIVNTKKTALQSALHADETAVPANYIVLNTVGYPPNAAHATLEGSVKTFQDLPTTGTDQLYKVQGATADGSNFTSYYVQREGATNVWDESRAPGLINGIDSLTMPHGLVREGDGTFTFAPFSWAPRRVGNESTNPPPRFIGRQIKNVFFYQNRLGFLVDEAVVFSRAGDFGNFWRLTVLDAIASDTLSVSAATNDVANLDSALPFNDGLMLFSRQRQFSLTHGEAGLTFDSVAVKPVTAFLMTEGVIPAVIGTRIFFAADSKGATSVYEYTRLPGVDATDAAEITAHVPHLIPAGVSHVIGATDHNALVLLANNSTDATVRKTLYTYQYYWDADRKVQSAWRPWTLPDGEPMSGTYLDGYLYLVVKRGGGLTLERLSLRVDDVTPDQDHMIFLDESKTLTGSYNAGTDQTTFTLPRAITSGRLVDLRLVRTKTSTTHPGGLIDPSTYIWSAGSPTLVKVPGHVTDAVTAGFVYPWLYQFSRQFAVDWQSRPRVSGRLQLHDFTVVYTDTGYFKAEVSPYGEDNAAVLAAAPTLATEFNGRVVGDGNLLLNDQIYASGRLTFSVAGDASKATIKLTNDTHIGCTFVSAEWSGLYFNPILP